MGNITFANCSQFELFGEGEGATWGWSLGQVDGVRGLVGQNLQWTSSATSSKSGFPSSDGETAEITRRSRSMTSRENPFSVVC